MEKMEKKLVNLKKLWEKKKVPFDKIIFEFCVFPSYMMVIVSTEQRKVLSGWEWCLTPVIPAPWEAKKGGSPEVRSSRQACPTWRNPVSTKNTKN